MTIENLNKTNGYYQKFSRFLSLWTNISAKICLPTGIGNYYNFPNSCSLQEKVNFQGINWRETSETYNMKL